MLVQMNGKLLLLLLPSSSSSSLLSLSLSEFVAVIIVGVVLVIVTGFGDVAFQFHFVWVKNVSYFWQPVQFGGFFIAAAGKARNENFVCLHLGLISASRCFVLLLQSPGFK